MAKKKIRVADNTDAEAAFSQYGYVAEVGKTAEVESSVAKILIDRGAAEEIRSERATKAPDEKKKTSRKKSSNGRRKKTMTKKSTGLA